MKKTLLLLTLALGISVQAVFAQSQKVKGRVVDDKGDGVPGASITVKGSKVGTITDIDGNYEIDLPEGSKTLVITSVTSGTKEVEVSDPSAPMTITMDIASDKNTLENVTIYGTTQSKRERVSAISTVTADQIAQRPVTNVISALEGNTPGVSFTSGGGQPGATPDILVRGIGSISASSSPLYVVDGAVFDGSLAAINPYDVASVSVLKDAAATSIYGARGANGVVMITTKKGRASDKPNINFDAQVGMFTRMIPEYERVGIKDYYELAYQAGANFVRPILGDDTDDWMKENFIDFFLGGYNAYNVPKNQLFVDGKINPNATLMYEDDWQKAVSRNVALRQKYNVSVSNGDSKSDYFFSVGYNNEKGIFKQSNYDRITTRLNVNSQITPWLRSGLSLGVTYDNRREFPFAGTNAYANPFMTTRYMAPIYPIYLHDTLGNLVYGPDGQPLYDFGDNPQYGQQRPYATNQNVVASLYNDNNTTKAFSGFGNGYLEATVLKDFKLKSTISINTYNGTSSLYQNKFFGDGEPFNGILTNSTLNQISYTWNQLLTWKPSFGIFGGAEPEHSLDITIGHENYLLRAENNSLQRAGFGPQPLEAGDVAAYGTGSGNSTDYHALESYLSQLNYSFRQRYTLTASFRRDGTSRFSKNRWGNFWAVGAGWLMSEEDFLKDNVKWINELKLRSSYGVAGNENLGGGTNYYSYLPLFYFNPNNTNPGFVFNTYGNPDLKWEGQWNFNVGVDFNLFNNRLSGSVDYYIRGSKDLLFVRPIAPSTGIGAIRENVGATRNSGIEAILHGSPVVSRTSKGFSWTVDMTLYRNKNKVTQVQGDRDTINQGNSLFAKGLPMSNFFLPRYAGVNPETGAEQWYAEYDAQGNPIEGGITPDYNIAELPVNRVISGTPFRELDGSLTNTFRYMGFDLSFMVTFGLGGKFYDQQYQNLMDGGGTGVGNAFHVDMLKAWRQKGDVTDVPALDYGSRTNRVSDRFLISNSFLNFKNVNLGYTFSDKMLKSAGFKSLRIYVALENIHVITARKGVDLQQNFGGFSETVYPPNRTLMFGLNVGL